VRTRSDARALGKAKLIPIAFPIHADDSDGDKAAIGFLNHTRRNIMKVLFVLTSHDQLGNTGRKTCFWLEEFAAPYYVFKDAVRKVRCS
jgi:hypothetical protein